jgi:ankyrin repeat protein
LQFLKEIAKKSPALLEEPNPQDGCTPLLNAVKRNNFNAAILLLSHGANVHAVDLSGNTALHHAIMARSPQMVKLLLLFRANPNAQNNAGKEAIALKTRFTDKFIIKIFYWMEILKKL